MTRVRIISSVVMAAVTALLPAVAGAGVSTGQFQSVPSTVWNHGAGLLDGAGTWVYVAQNPAPGPNQTSTDGYVYELDFAPSNNGGYGRIGLSVSGGVPVAGIQLVQESGSVPNPTSVTPYPWERGRFYFLLTYHLGGGLWGGWVYDLLGASWTHIGSVQAENPGLLEPTTYNRVHGAAGVPVAAFSVDAIEAVPDCSWFPRVDAYFFPNIHFRGGVSWYSNPEPATTLYGLGDCPTTVTPEYAWQHHHLGTLPAA